jgi:hypothetical protein
MASVPQENPEEDWAFSWVREDTTSAIAVRTDLIFIGWVLFVETNVGYRF